MSDPRSGAAHDTAHGGAHDASRDSGGDGHDPVRDAAGYWVALGNRLRKSREYLGYSQLYVAEQTGIPRSAISDVERGSRKVDSLELRKFARLFRLPVSQLVGLDNDTGEAPVQALARSMSDLTEQDLQEVAQFAAFLRFSAAQTRDENGGTTR